MTFSIPYTGSAKIYSVPIRKRKENFLLSDPNNVYHRV